MCDTAEQLNEIFLLVFLENVDCFIPRFGRERFIRLRTTEEKRDYKPKPMNSRSDSEGRAENGPVDASK